MCEEESPVCVVSVAMERSPLMWSYGCRPVIMVGSIVYEKESTVCIVSVAMERSPLMLPYGCRP